MRAMNVEMSIDISIKIENMPALTIGFYKVCFDRSLEMDSYYPGKVPTLYRSTVRKINLVWNFIERYSIIG